MKNKVKLAAIGQETNMSEIIKQRLLKDNVRYFANDNISKYITEQELDLLQKEVADHIKSMLKSLVIDIDNDHNTQDTANRISKMFLNEIFKGRYLKKPEITAFPNEKYDELYITGPISIRSTCAHHFQNIKGNCWIGVYPGKNVIGLSKFNRIVDWIASRPQLQEEMTVQIAEEVQKCTGADGIAVIIKAEHSCLTHRGYKEHESDMTTSVLRGKLQEEPLLRQEFFSLLQGMKKS